MYADLVGGTKGWRLDEHVLFNDSAGVRRHAAIFVKDGLPCYMHWDMDIGQLKDLNTEYKKPGFRLRSLSVSKRTGAKQRDWAAIWVPADEDRRFRTGMSAEDYQQESDAFARKGYRLYRVQGYDDSKWFAAVWAQA